MSIEDDTKKLINLMKSYGTAASQVEIGLRSGLRDGNFDNMEYFVQMAAESAGTMKQRADSVLQQIRSQVKPSGAMKAGSIRTPPRVGG